MNRYTLAKSGLKVMLLVSVAALAVIAATASPAQAQYTCPPDNPWCGCLDDFQSGSVCTANDVQIATMSVEKTIDTCGQPGDTGRFIFRVNAVAGASERYDIGFFIGLDGGSAQLPSRLPYGASCYHGYLPPPLSFDRTPSGQIRYSPFYNAETESDTCGDIEQGVTTSYVTEEISVKCVDNDNDGVVDPVSTCVSWDNQKNNTPVCTSVAQAYPNTKSKCRCENVPIPTLVIRKIVVDKVTYPAGDPTPFNFTLTGPSTTIAFSLKDEDPEYISPLLARATYAVAETVPEGWVLTKAECRYYGDETTFSPNSIPLTENREVRCTFYNKKLEGGGKFVDLNWNGREDAGEALLGGWPIRITSVVTSSLVYTVTVTTRTNGPDMGRWFFPANLLPGVYDVEEVTPSAPDYFQTYPDTNNGVYRIQYNGAQPGEGPTFTPLFELLSKPPTGFHELDFGNVWVDFGDLPDEISGFPSYPTKLANNGARHTLDGRYLGAGADAEREGCPCSCCGGDDANRPIDDEDGVVFSSMSNWAAGPGVVDVTVGGGAGCLNAWLDFTNDEGGGVGLNFRDGDFNDSYQGVSEWIIQNHRLEIGTTNISFALPPGFLGNEARSYYFRFRFTPRDADGGCDKAEAYVTGGVTLASLLPGNQTGGGASPLGLAIGGEVEDYRLDLSPLAVTLASFTAEATADGVTLTWETVSETDNAGFNIYRAESEAGPWTRLNTTLIPAAAPGSAQGAAYTWTDTAVMPGLTYWYALEDVALNGATTRHAPVVVTVVAPNALQVTNLAAASGSAQAVPLVALVSALVSGFALARRRR